MATVAEPKPRRWRWPLWIGLGLVASATSILLVAAIAALSHKPSPIVPSLTVVISGDTAGWIVPWTGSNKAQAGPKSGSSRTEIARRIGVGLPAGHGTGRSAASSSASSVRYEMPRRPSSWRPPSFRNRPRWASRT